MVTMTVLLAAASTRMLASPAGSRLQLAFFQSSVELVRGGTRSDGAAVSSRSVLSCADGVLAVQPHSLQHVIVRAMAWVRSSASSGCR